MKNREKQLKELAALRKQIAELEPLSWSRTACPRRVVEAMGQIARLRRRADEIERRIAQHGG